MSSEYRIDGIREMLARGWFNCLSKSSGREIHHSPLTIHQFNNNSLIFETLKVDYVFHSLNLLWLADLAGNLELSYKLRV